MANPLSNISIQTVYLAALLHDIGKFWQRSDRYQAGKWEALDTSRFNPQTYCPVYQGNYSHKHVLWTAQFIEDILQYTSAAAGKDSLTLLAAMHHNPGGYLPYQLITLADHLSSGMDRNQLTGDVQWEISSGSSYRNTPLKPVFSVIASNQHQSSTYSMPVNALDNQNVMPAEQEGAAIEKGYRHTWQQFQDAIKNILSHTPCEPWQNGSVADTIYYLLQRYTSYIPSSTVDLPDISLFDHSKTVAAFATCLFCYLTKNPHLRPDDLRNDESVEPFILFGTELCGIQEFLYNIISRHAAKNLKGRSFYLHLITTTFARKIIDQFGLFEANIIYNAGGVFFLLLPNTRAVKDTLSQLAIEANDELVKKFDGELALATGSVSFNCRKVLNKEIHILWQQLFERIKQDKRQRFRQLINGSTGNHYHLFFEPSGPSGKGLLKDAITGRLLTPDDTAIRLRDVNGNVSVHTKEQIELGRKLKGARYWLFAPGNHPQADTVLFGYSHILLDDLNALPGTPDRSRLICFNDTALIVQAISHPRVDPCRCMVGFEFYGGNTYPVDAHGMPKTYDQLPRDNFKKNAVVRMDVDNLGYMFQHGFAPGQRSFSRYSQLSRSLDLYFKGYLTHLWQSRPEYRDHTVIVYAGGDDLFLLGDWQTAIQLAIEIRNRFRQYVCHHPLFTISGGIVVTPPKYPVLTMADECAAMEATGKQYRWRNQSVAYPAGNGTFQQYPKKKDAVGFLNTALAWDVEFEKIHDKAKQLRDKILNNQLPTSLLHKLMFYYHFAGISTTGEITRPRFHWLISYDFGRMKIRYKNEKTFLDDILFDIFNKKWNNNPLDSPYHPLQLYALAARWAEWMIRDQKN